jgi:A/G-specific adenine glycosylase
MIDAGAVLAWGGAWRRDLPWRATRDPWRILVAEVMLQQTGIDRVVPKWEGFLRAYPQPAACAAAPLGDVLRLWQGLGYPRRARNLHDSACVIAQRHDGAVPDALDALMALPGVGPYTARAVLAFAFERDVAVVDTNVARLLARTGGRRLTGQAAQIAADRLVPAGAGWSWNQTMIDLGASVCRPVPRCEACPVAGGCRWHVAGRPSPDPAVGSAGVSTSQRPFAGSARQARGRVLAALAGGPAPLLSFEPGIVAGLVADRLVSVDGDEIRLP